MSPANSELFWLVSNDNCGGRANDKATYTRNRLDFWSIPLYAIIYLQSEGNVFSRKKRKRGALALGLYLKPLTATISNIVQDEKTNMKFKNILEDFFSQLFCWCATKMHKTGVINDPLCQPTIPTGSDSFLLLKSKDVQTFVEIVITTGHGGGWSRGSILLCPFIIIYHILLINLYLVGFFGSV